MNLKQENRKDDQPCSNQHKYRDLSPEKGLSEINGSDGIRDFGNARRRRSTPFQSGLSARERANNLRSAFSVGGDLSSKHVLIVDDVITTGTTVRQLARILKKAGANKVSALAIARSG
jgi:predicted amidophosphoribosyltransferase